MKNKDIGELINKYSKLLEKYKVKYKKVGLTEKEADEIVGLIYQLKSKRPMIFKDFNDETLKLYFSLDKLSSGFRDLQSSLANQGAYKRFTNEEIEYVKKNSDLLSFVLYENGINEMIKAYNDKRKDKFRFYAETSYAFICSFHREKTASLGITADLGLYHCFGCGSSGDIFKYVMNQYNMTFKNAVKLVANVFMIRLYETHSNESNLIKGVRNTFISDDYLQLMEMRKTRNTKLNYTNDLYNKELRDRVLNGVWDETLVRKDFKKPAFKEFIDSERYYEEMVDDYFVSTQEDYQSQVDIDHLTDIEDTLFPDFELPVECINEIVIEKEVVKEVKKEINTSSKNVALFYCDIAGTITPSGDEDYRTSYKKLTSLLEQLRIQHNADELIFSHSTSDSKKDYLFYSVEKIKENITDESIVIGNQYMESGCYNSNGELLKSYKSNHKEAELVTYVNELSENNNVVFVGFADDSIASYTIEKIASEIPFVPTVYGFIPGFKDLTTDLASYSSPDDISGLIKSIENYLNKYVIKDGENDYYGNISKGALTLKK